MAYAMRHHGLPALALFDVLLQRHVYMQVHEDNQAMMQCVKSGKNPTMRYLHRTHRVSVGWLHERFQGKEMELVYEASPRMCADIYTKTFTDKDKWRHACWLIGLVDPKELSSMLKWMAELPETEVPVSTPGALEDAAPAGSADAAPRSRSGGEPGDGSREGAVNGGTPTSPPGYAQHIPVRPAMGTR